MLTKDLSIIEGIERVPQDFKKFLDFVSRQHYEVYIFGADIAGKAVQKILQSEGVKVKGFLDNNKNKCDIELNGIHVHHAPHLDTLSKDSIVLIASTYIADIIEQLESQGFYNWAPISFIIEEKDVL